MEEENTGNRCNICLREGIIACFQSACQNAQVKCKDNADTFQTQKGIILDQALLLADI